MEIVLSTFGANLNVDNEGFVVTQGNMRQRISADDVSCIQISKGASITSDAALLAINKEIEVIFVDRQGHPSGRIWSPKYGSISNIRKGQLHFSTTIGAVYWIRDVIAQKIANQQAMLLMMTSDDLQKGKVDKAIHQLEVYRIKVRNLMGDCVNDIANTLRGWEGMASKIYFQTLNLFLPDHLRFAERSQHPAMDPVNAFLNYGYGVLYSRIEGDLIKAGIDPYIGILHRDEYNRPVLVYDVIELFRIWVDYVVYNLACQDVITNDYYSVQADNSFWLEQLGRRVLIQSLNDYLEEVIEFEGRPRSRETHMQDYAQDLAQKFKTYKP